MGKSSPKWLSLGEWLLNRRWWWISLASLSVFVFEYLEYRPFQQGTGIAAGFFFEIAFYGIVLPVSTGLALTWLAASRADMAQSIYYQTINRNLEIQLNTANTHAKLAEGILDFIKLVTPLVGVTQYKYAQDLQSYQFVSKWPPGNPSDKLSSTLDCTAPDCPCLNIRPGQKSMTLHPCRDPRLAATSPNSDCFCIPFLFLDSPVASARLHLPSDKSPSLQQIRAIEEVSPDIAAAYHRVQLERLMKRQGDQINIEQKRIARDVHDTLGHSLAYLRLRLDQISTGFNEAGNTALQLEVTALRDIAKEAYEQMRDMLITLSPSNDLNINDILENYAARISKRANFELTVLRYGKPRALTPLVQRNIINVFREILTNIENHAHARQVDLALNWKKKSLEIKVEDNGVGFDPALPVEYGHFGLSNMRERALESKARLSIASQPGRGTRITINVPYEDEL